MSTLMIKLTVILVKSINTYEHGAIKMIKRTISSSANTIKQTKMTLKQWLAKRLIDKQISQRRLSTILKIDSASFSRTIAGKRRLQIHEANAIAEFFDVPLDEVLDRFGLVHGSVKEVDLVGTIDEIGKFKDLGAQKVKVKAIPQGEHLFAAQWRSEGAMDGFLFHMEKEVVPIETDKLGLLHLADGTSIVGVALRGYLPNRYRISTITDGKLDDVEITSMNRVKAVLPP
jgi:transcriptional regulator with XRE-family HTH domain